MTTQQSQAVPDYSDPVLLEALSSLLPLLRDGISEYELIKALQQPPWLLFEGLDLSDSLAMFRCHFVLFNALYTISDELREQGLGELDIHTLSIRLKPVTTFDAAITKHDGLKAYYLDWANFSQTTTADVDALLNDFWQRMAGKTASASEVNEALITLELAETDNLTVNLVKKQYRKLLQQHHPDKGGNTASAQAISHAYRVLCSSLR